MYASTLSITAFEHLSNHSNERLILHGSCYPFLIAQLSCDCLGSTMRTLFDLDINPKTRRKGLLEADPYSQADDSR